MSIIWEKPSVDRWASRGRNGSHPGALTKAGVPVAVHSDAPLASAPAARAASVQGDARRAKAAPGEAEMALSPYEALEAITLTQHAGP
ncbi:MAG: hypothetical protein R3B98_06835 [Hyphomonas sp.]